MPVPGRASRRSAAGSKPVTAPLAREPRREHAAHVPQPDHAHRRLPWHGRAVYVAAREPPRLRRALRPSRGAPRRALLRPGRRPTRTTRRWRWTTSCGRSSATGRRSSSTPASGPRPRSAAGARSSPTRSRCSRALGVDAADGARRRPHPPALRPLRPPRRVPARAVLGPGATSSRSGPAATPAAARSAGSSSRPTSSSSSGSTSSAACGSSTATRRWPTASALHLVGGHAPGLQVVRVETGDGPLVLASDAAHFYANLEHDRPYAIVHSLPGMYDAFDRVRALAGGDDDADRARPRPARARALPGREPGARRASRSRCARLRRLTPRVGFAPWRRPGCSAWSWRAARASASRR